MNRNAAVLLGLARRAGKCLLGYDSIRKASQSICLLLCAQDCSERMQKNILALNRYCITLDLTKAELGKLLGAGEVSLVAVIDKNFAAGIESKLSDDGGN